MLIERYDDYEQLSLKVAELVKSQILNRPESVLGLATGSTPLGLYDNLIVMHKSGEIDFSGVKTFNLDEYCGLSNDHPQSYYQFMQRHLFQHVNLKSENTHMPPPPIEDNFMDCQAYDNLILQNNGIDLQVLGIGRNGHIGFNEPGTSFSSRTHVVQLHEQTRTANARFFSSVDEVPKEAVTMGIKTIMRAKKILLIISGQSKQQAVYQLVFSPVDEKFPASVLQLHPDVTVLADRMATATLEQECSFTNNVLNI